MNNRQRKFADFFIECGNATEAAKKAGYKQPKQQGSRLLTNVDLLEYIKRRTAPAEQKRIASGDDALRFFTRVMDGREKGVTMAERISAGREILKRDIADKKIEIELLKLESQIKDNQPEEEAKDNLLDALNSAARKVWEESEETEGEQYRD